MIPVKLWWDNRHKLNRKMAQSLRDELADQLTRAEALILNQKSSLGLEREAVDQRNKALLDDLKQRITEMDEILKKF